MSHKPQYTHPAPDHTDSWHLHTADEGMPQEEHAGKANAAVLAGVFIGSFLFVGVVILVTYLYFEVQFTHARELRIETTALGQDARDYKAKTLQQLQQYTFPSDLSARAGQVEVPVPEAEQRVLAQYAHGGGSK